MMLFLPASREAFLMSASRYFPLDVCHERCIKVLQFELRKGSHGALITCAFLKLGHCRLLRLLSVLIFFPSKNINSICCQSSDLKKKKDEGKVQVKSTSLQIQTHKRFKRMLVLKRQHKTCAHFQDKPFFFKQQTVRQTHTDRGLSDDK